MTPQALIRGMRQLLMMWPKRAETLEDIQALTALYGQALDDLADEEFLAACGQALATCTFFPTAGELRELVVARRPDPAIRAYQTAQVAGLLAAPPPLLPERITSPEQQAERERRQAEVRQRTVEAMQRATAGHLGRRRPERRTYRGRQDYDGAADAERVMDRFRQQG